MLSIHLKLSLLLSGMLMACISLLGQCDPTQITTDPDAPFNPENPAKENTFFDWRQQTFSLYQTIDNVSTTSNPPSPFYQIGNAEVVHLYNSEDYKPEDGWELIVRNLGYKDDGTTWDDLSNPYIILYNRFHGLMRCFVIIGQREADYKAISFELSFQDARNVQTALFQNLAPLVEPVKDFDNSISSLAGISEFIQEPRKWMMAEFEMAYDPCTCNDDSKLLLEVSLVDTAQIVMSGSSEGQIVDVKDKTGGSGKKATDFSSAYGKADKAIKSGKTRYKNLSDFSDKAFKFVGDTTDFKEKDKIRRGIKKLGEGLLQSDSGVSKFLKDGLRALPYVGAAASAVYSLVAGGNSSAPQNVRLAPMATSSRISLSGIITTDKLYSTIIFNNPGSPQAGNPGDLYPYYDEVLGVMSLLRRPNIEVEKYQYETDFSYDDQAGNYELYERRIYQVGLEGDVLYAVNPATDFDMSHHDMLGAVFVRIPIRKAKDVKGLIQVRDYLYRTPYLPFSCLNGYRGEFRLDGDINILSNYPFKHPEETYIQIIANLKRRDDPEAQNVIWQNTYRANMNSQSRSAAGPLDIPAPSYPNLLGEDVTLGGNIAGNTDLYATDSIFISSSTSFGTSGPIRIVAGRVIAVETNTSIPPNVELITGEVIPVCQSDLPQATQSQINSICTSSTYLSKAALKKEASHPSLQRTASLSLTAHPNPTADRLTLRYTLPTEARVSLTLYDLTGRPVLPIQTEVLTKAGPQETSVDLSGLAAGMYQVVLQTDEQRQGVKVVKTD